MIDRRIASSVLLGAALALGCTSAPSPNGTTTVAARPTPGTPAASPTPIGPTLVPLATASSADPVASSYEAVFLRLEVVDGSPSVLAIGVDPAGHERLIARIASTSSDIRSQGEAFIAPMGAVSRSGLLAIPRADGDLRRLGIFDLQRPDAAPVLVAAIEVDLDRQNPRPFMASDHRPRVHWVSGEHLAIPSYGCDASSCGIYAFFDGRSGAAVARLRSEPNCLSRARMDAEILVVAGGVVRREADGSRKQLVAPSHVQFACVAPDDSLLVHGRGLSPSDPVAGLIALESGTDFVIEGNFAGWLAVAP